MSAGCAAKAEIRQASAGTAPRVREDDAQVRMAGQRAGVDEMRDGAGDVEDELHERRRVPEAGLREAGRGGGVEQDGGAAPVELGQDRVEGGLAEVAGGVVGRQDHAVEREVAQAVVDLRQGRVHVRQWQVRQGAEATGVLVDDLGRRLIETAGEFRCAAPPGEPVRGGRRDRQDLGVDPLTVHEVQRTGQAPLRYGDAAVEAAQPGLPGGLQIGGGQEVGVDVDPGGGGRCAHGGDLLLAYG